MPGSHSMRWLVFLVCGAFAALGCSTDIQQGDSASGSLSLDLVLADGIVINSVSWEISGGDMEPMSGTINTSAPGSTASVEVFGLPPGDDYLVELEATSVDEEVTCRGSAEFGVEIGVSTDVMVMLNCKLPPRFGGVRVNGKFNICATLAKVVVSPLQTSVGNDIDLSAIGVDEEGDDITYVWSNGAGTIGDPNAQETTYTCAEVGNHEITITVSDVDFEYCMDDWTVPVRCVPGDEDLCEEVDCDDGKQCVANRCNPANGECIDTEVEDGTKCDLLGLGDGVCESGECVEENLCEDVDCDDGKECTLDLCDPETGDCKNAPVDDGTECDPPGLGDGICIEGECIDVDLCDGVECPDTGNDCTVAVCNIGDGLCDEMNAENGTDCNEGSGLCAEGVCVIGTLCDEVDCSSSDDCVQDGMCDPSSGECIPGDDETADTPCSVVLFDGVCNGSGTCVECNDAEQCGGTGNECTAATCSVAGTCGTENVMDGVSCDLIGLGDGICEGGTCVDAPECNTSIDCNDDNECTTQECVAGVCVYNPDDGASCIDGGLPGTCDDQGVCIGLCDGADCTSSDQCVQDGSCDDQTGDCIPGDNEPDDSPCDAGEGPGSGECSNGQCSPLVVVPGPQVFTVQNSCGLPTAVSSVLVPFPALVDVTPTSAPLASSAFTMDIQTAVILDPAFLQGAAGTLFAGFGLFLEEVTLTVAQTEVA
ncbi:MAG: PKD domain-containing protein, partial [Deltaproteobacteria bacterium]|nr:PKD domain-containing protein [Deltaproteobacteria bacterium]